MLLDVTSYPIPSPTEARAMRSHMNRLRGKKPVRGAAQFTALQAMAAYNSSRSEYLIYPDSIRYWWLVTLHDLDWARKRIGGRMTHERLARQLYDAAVTHRATRDRYYPFSRFRRHLAELNYDRRGVEQSLSIDLRERRRLLLAWREKSRPALRKLLRLIDEYRRIRPAVSLRRSSRIVHQGEAQ